MYSGELHQACACSIDGNSSSTSRFGCQSPSSTSILSAAGDEAAAELRQRRRHQAAVVLVAHRVFHGHVRNDVGGHVAILPGRGSRGSRFAVHRLKIRLQHVSAPSALASSDTSTVRTVATAAEAGVRPRIRRRADRDISDSQDIRCRRLGWIDLDDLVIREHLTDRSTPGSE